MASASPWCHWPSQDFLVHLHAFMVPDLLLYWCSADIWPMLAAGTSNGSSISLVLLAFSGFCCASSCLHGTLPAALLVLS